MCEFCTQHGEGKQWYLAMKNYGQDLLEQTGRREYVRNFFKDFETSIARSLPWLDAIQSLPFIPDIATNALVGHQKQRHFGQVVPIEDVDQILNVVHSVVRIPCACRSMTTASTQTRYCYGLGIDPTGLVGQFPDYAENLEWLNPEAAGQAIHRLDREGLVHSVWTFDTPFIAGLCNCDQDCMAYRLQIRTNLLQVYFPAEYHAQIDPEQCTGCRACEKGCSFSAITFDRSNKKCTIDPDRCYGCGICRSRCKKEAIRLSPRIHPLTWKRYPKSFPNYRIRTKPCTDLRSCRKCLAVCPNQVLGVVPRTPREAGQRPGDWQVRSILPSRCNGCGECARVCPEDCLTVKKYLSLS